MKETWNYELMDLLKNARLGNIQELNSFLEKYSPLVVTNEDYSILLLFRHFHADVTQNKISVLNCHPEENDFQCGITIVTYSEDGGSQSNIYLPNSFSYKELKLQDSKIEIITSDNKIHTTNVTELFRKLDFWGDFTKGEVENGFKSLCDEQYEKPKKLEVKNKIIKTKSLGKLTYNDDLELYEGKFKADGKIVEVNVYNTELNELEKLISFVDEQINTKFYKEILLLMESKMIKLKNDVWLEEDEDTGEEESIMTVENFRKRISISSIIFYADFSSSIYCNDDNIFFGHTINISVDENGKYKDVNLAG